MMRKWMVVLAVGLLAAQATAAQVKAPQAKAAPAKPAQAPALKIQKDKVSYAIGVNIARNLKRQGVEVNVDNLVRGLRDALSGAKLLLTQDALDATMQAFDAERMQKYALALKMAADKNQKAGEAFMAANKTKEGVVTLPSGLQYKIVKAGEGKTPTDTDTV